MRRFRPRFEGVPARSLAGMFFGVFLVFAPVMVLATSRFDPQREPGPLLFWGVVSGLVGMGYAFAATMGRKWFAIVIPFHMFTIFMMSNHWPPGLSMDRPNPGWDSLGAIVCLAGGYAFMIRFSRSQGARAARLQAELDLAANIHRSLVPDINLTSRGLQIHGISRASHSMGGDLIDLAQRPGETDVFLADVSGHGVGAGIVMGMVKSAIRMRLRAAAPLETLVSDLNSVLADMIEPNMFATFACLRFVENGRAQFALAGHLPILHFEAATGAMHELPNDSLPLGVDALESFHAGEVALKSGDTLVIFTDGLIEVQDAGGRLLGLAALKQVIRDNIGQPLDLLYAVVMARVQSHGPQQDDQTLLLVRVA